MSISSTTRKAGPYNGNGSQTAFAFSFKVFQASDLLVVKTDTSGVETNQTLTTHYTVSLNANQDDNPGGTVTMVTAPDTGYKITITSAVPATQAVQLANQGGFYPSVINSALDRLTILAQQLAEQVGRAVKVGISSSTNPDQLIDDLTAASIAAVASASAASSSASAASASAADAAASAAALPNTSGGANTVAVVNGTATGWLYKTAAQFLTFLGANTANGAVVLDGSARLPAVDGSQLTGISAGDHAVQDLRLTLTTATPVTTSDVTAATTLYLTPYKGKQIGLYSGTAWSIITTAEVSLALGTITSGKPYDVFAYDNAGTVTLEILVWTNDTTRATALAYQDGVLVKSGAATRRYLGTFYTTSTTTTEDSNAKRYLYNYYNRVARSLKRIESTASWTYTTAAWRQANGSASNQVEFIQGVQEDRVFFTAQCSNSNPSGCGSAVGIGIDSTSTISGTALYGRTDSNGGGSIGQYRDYPGVGRHYAAWLEWSQAVGTTTWYGSGSGFPSGIQGEVFA